MRQLHWGDNLTVLRQDIADDSVDLIYLDPPFNSNRNYNVLFKDDDTKDESDAQIEAFTDTWHWTDSAEETYWELVHGNHVPQKVSDLIVAMRSFIGSNDVMAYLVMMTIRLLELHRVLKPTGSIYLHCDPTASHYLKVVMDTIWGAKLFLNEVTWKRTHSHGDSRRKFGNLSDRLLIYAKSGDYTFNRQYMPYSQDYVDKYYRHKDESGRRYQLVTLRSPNPRPNLVYEYKGYKPHPNGWAVSPEKMAQLDEEGRLHFPTKPDGAIREKYFLDEMPGVLVGDVWSDINPISARAAERLGYPTQKPEALLERIIRASSNEGDVVLDPFCGCGTAVAVAERLNRQWIGIDLTHLAISLIVSRMESAFPGIEIERHGEPADLGGARALAELDRYDFQNWALSLVAARSVNDGKKGADRGIDGVLSFLGTSKKPHRCLVQVKSGHVNSATIRDLVGTVDREGAAMGLLITLEEPTKPMTVEALEAGYYESELMQRNYPKIQILTIEQLLHGQQPSMPPLYSPYRLAQRQQRAAQQGELFERQTGT